MSGNAGYQRRISATEARNGYLFVLAGCVPFFPPAGQTFRLTLPIGVQETRLEAEVCSCRGPEKPHEHWRLPVMGLVAGQLVAVERLAENAYRLAVIG